MTSSLNMETSVTNDFHPLDHEWILYAHLPHDTDWSINSYKTILKTNKLEEYITLMESLPDSMINNCMLFVMKNGIKPIWEDELNRNGGCFSYKVSNKQVVKVWKNLAYKLVGNTLFKDNVNGNVNGITISPKKNFCIIKIWLKDCTNKNPDTINYFMGLSSHGCLFKKHLIK